MQPTDEQLMIAYQEGDVEAFEELVRRHQARVFTYLLQLVGDRELAHDLFQETFMHVIEVARKRRYRPDARWLTWVFRIARNVAIDEFRRQHHRHTYDLDEVEVAYEPEEHLEQKELAAVLERCIAQLPPAQREVVYLRHHGRLTFKEIAEITGASINTVLGRMRYALKHLRRHLTAMEWKPDHQDHA